jgi:hypothetical protein
MRQATLVGTGKTGPVAPLAIGSRFYPEVATEIAGTSTPNLRFESADAYVIAVDGSALVAKSPGAAAVLISTDDGSVVDFIHVWAAPVTDIVLATRDGERFAGSLGLAVGEDFTLVPSLYNDAQKLAGAADATWTVDSDATLAVLRDGSVDRRRLRARAPGHAVVTVAVGNAKATFDVEVVP